MNINKTRQQRKHFWMGCLFIFFILTCYAIVGGYERYLDRKLEMLVECKDGTTHYEVLDDSEEFKCEWRKLTFL